MNGLILSGHALEEMDNASISEDDVYHVVGDANDVIERDDGRTVYIRLLDDGREAVVVIEDDGQTVVTVWQWKRRRPRRR
jgi:hypothetical protein